MDYPRKNGAKRKQLQHVLNTTGIFPDELQEPIIPEAYLDVWFYFWDIGAAGALTYTEIASYMQVSGEYISPVTARNLIRLSGIYSAEIARIQQDER